MGLSANCSQEGEGEGFCYGCQGDKMGEMQLQRLPAGLGEFAPSTHTFGPLNMPHAQGTFVPIHNSLQVRLWHAGEKAVIREASLGFGVSGCDFSKEPYPSRARGGRATLHIAFGSIGPYRYVPSLRGWLCPSEKHAAAPRLALPPGLVAERPGVTMVAAGCRAGFFTQPLAVEALCNISWVCDAGCNILWVCDAGCKAG